MSLRNFARTPGRPHLSGFFSGCLFVVLVLFAPVFYPEASAAQTVRKDAFIAQLFQARGFEAPKGERDPVKAALDLDLVPVPEGKLDGAVTMREAIVYAVHSLGLRSAAEILADAPLPFGDVSNLKPIEKGSLAVAINMNPPLLKKGVSSFGPNRNLSLKDAKNIAAIVKSASNNLYLSAVYSPVRGMTVHVNRRGTNDRPPRWRGVVNGFDTRDEAELFSEALAGAGIESTVDSWNYDWRVRSPLYDVYGPVRQFLEACENLGRKGTVFSSPSSWETAAGPWFWIMIVFDPAKFAIRPIVPAEGLGILAPLSSMTAGTAAALNGGYFTTAGKEKGSPIGVIIDRGLMANPPYQGRTVLGWNEQNQAAFGQMDWKAEVHFPGAGYMDVTGINKMPKEGAVLLFTSHFGESTPVFAGPVVEIVLDGSTCTEVRRDGGNPIPRGQTVLAVYGNPARFLESLARGDRVELRQTINGGDPYWSSMTNAIQGGPFLLSKGIFVQDGENLGDSIVNKRHPRSVIGLTEKGQWFFFAGDGRNAVHSVGFTLAETAEILKKNGAYYALNLDGGGSTTISVEGRVINRLSDGRERPVSYGVGAFPR